MEELSKSLGAIANVLEALHQRANDQSSINSIVPSISKTPIALALPSFDPESTDSSIWLSKIDGY